MKILIINSVCGIGSTGRICTDLAQEFEMQGHEVKVAYGRGEVPEKYRKYSIRIGRKWDIYLHALKTRVFDATGFGSRQATKRFLQWADVYNPDIIWLHNLHGYYINIELLFQWIKTHPEKEIRWTLHDCWAFTGHCPYFTFARCERWKKQCEHCPQKEDYPKSVLLDRSHKNYIQKQRLFRNVQNMTLITPSRWLADLANESFLGEYVIEVKHNVIDTNILKPTQSDFRREYNLEGKIVILGVASVWSRRKGLKDFITLSKMLDDNYAIVLVGLNNRQIRSISKLSSIIGIKRTNDVVHLAQIYSAADFFVNPTYEDNYPTVNLEAEACGTRVLTYDTGGCSETIKRSDSKIVKTGDIRSILEIILKRERE